MAPYKLLIPRPLLRAISKKAKRSGNPAAAWIRDQLTQLVDEKDLAHFERLEEETARRRRGLDTASA